MPSKERGLFFSQRFKRAVAQKLLIIPDEILFELPFDLLKAPNGKLLIELATVWYHYRDREYKKNNVKTRR